jgi:glucans biosynthesis protein C
MEGASPVHETRPAGGSPRQHYIDWLRVLAVLLLFPFHVTRVFNSGEAFYVKSARLSGALDYALSFISVWHMQLLFLLAGASTYYALRKRGGGQYLSERVKRLLVPFVFGFWVLIPPQTWYGARFNSGYTDSFWHYLTSGDFLVYNVQDGGDYFGGFGIGHLWFILVLFLISIVVLPLLLWGRTERGGRRSGSFARRLAHPAWWLLPPFFIMVGDALPQLELRPFYYAVFFVLGWVVMFDDRFIHAAERYRWPALAAAAGLALFWIFTDGLRNAQPDPSLPLAGLNYLGMMGTWLALVGLLGCGKRYLDRPSLALSYLAQGSYPIYILHQTVIVVIAFYLVGMPGPGWVEWLALLAASVAGTFALYEFVRRAAALRFLFGMRGATRPSSGRQESRPGSAAKA